MNSNLLKFIGAVLLFAVWGVFAWMGKTPADGFITAVGAAISGLGIYHARSSANAPAQAPLVETIAPAVAPQSTTPTAQ